MNSEIKEWNLNLFILLFYFPIIYKITNYIYKCFWRLSGKYPIFRIWLRCCLSEKTGIINILVASKLLFSHRKSLVYTIDADYLSIGIIFSTRIRSVYSLYLLIAVHCKWIDINKWNNLETKHVSWLIKCYLRFKFNLNCPKSNIFTSAIFIIK